MVGVSLGDIISLASLAKDLCDTYRKSPERYRAISSDVDALSMVLRRVGEASQGSRMTTDQEMDLTKLIIDAKSILEDLNRRLLEVKALGSASRLSWDRFRWDRKDFDSMRDRVKTTCDLLAALNTSIILSLLNPASDDTSKRAIVEKLEERFDELLQEVKKNAAVLPPVDVASPVPAQDESAALKHISEVLQKQGISETDLVENRVLIAQWIKMAMESRGTVPKAERKIEILSATYGPKNVTEVVRNRVKSSRKSGSTSVDFSVSNSFFKGDPLRGQGKAFVLVWRIKGVLDLGAVYSAPQTLRRLEGERVHLEIDGDLPVYEPPPTAPKRSNIHILSATYHHLDVISAVREIASNERVPTITAANGSFGTDPMFGTSKILSITYTYNITSDLLLNDIHVQTAREGDWIRLPPKLTIHSAYWADMDITVQVRDLVDPLKQTAQIPTGFFPADDPWYGTRKTISVVYSYGRPDGRPKFQLLVTKDSDGTHELKPDRPLDLDFVFTDDDDDEEQLPGRDFRIVAGVWGILPVNEARFLVAARDGEVPCSNEFFRRDGFPGWGKTCQIYIRQEDTGNVRCLVAKEGQHLRIPASFDDEE